MVDDHSMSNQCSRLIFGLFALARAKVFAYFYIKIYFFILHNYFSKTPTSDYMFYVIFY